MTRIGNVFTVNNLVSTYQPDGVHIAFNESYSYVFNPTLVPTGTYVNAQYQMPDGSQRTFNATWKNVTNPYVSTTPQTLLTEILQKKGLQS